MESNPTPDKSNTYTHCIYFGNKAGRTEQNMLFKKERMERNMLFLDLCTYLALSKKTVINLFYFCNQIWKKGYLFELLQLIPQGESGCFRGLRLTLLRVFAGHFLFFVRMLDISKILAAGSKIAKVIREPASFLCRNCIFSCGNISYAHTRKASLRCNRNVDPSKNTSPSTQSMGRMTDS